VFKKAVTVNFLSRTASLEGFVVFKQAISYLELLTVDRHIYSINKIFLNRDRVDISFLQVGTAHNMQQNTLLQGAT
jgi:hypothetical protein